MPSSIPEEPWEALFQSLAEHERRRDSRKLGPDGAESPPSLPRYEIQEQVGEGTTATVYRAWDRELNRTVALKMMRERLGWNSMAQERFRREAQAAAGVTHPNVVTVHDVGEEGGRPYLVMELVEGRPLNETLADRRLAQAEILGLLEKVARGVGAVHEKGIVHRDLKPANILVTVSGEPKVGDFGLAHLMDSTMALTRTGVSLGTPFYMAPEQVEGRSKDITPRTDVYAMGVILYEALTGAPPHTGDNPQELYAKVIHKDPLPPCQVNPGVSRDLETIVLKALEKEPKRRYATAGALADDLRRYRGGEPIAARPATWRYRMWRRIRRNRLAYGLGVGGMAALLVAGVLWEIRRRERERALETIREKARMALDAALEFRRLGHNDRMWKYLPELESAYREATRQAPNMAEVDYLMGRMHRALMEDAKAFEYQERALGKDPNYAPALYERTVLLSKGQRWETWKFGLEGVVSPPGGRWLRQAELRERLLDDLTRFDRLIRKGSSTPWPMKIGPPNVLASRGILAFCSEQFEEAHQVLREALRMDPLIEEAWEFLAWAELNDPRDRPVASLWRAAEEIYTEALARDRGYVPHLLNRGMIRFQRADYQMCRGGDPSQDFAAAEADFGEAVRLGAGDLYSSIWRALMRMSRGIWRMCRGEGPQEDFAGAEVDLTKALRFRRDVAWVLDLRGYVRTHRGIYLMDRGEDPSANLAAAEADVREALEIQSTDHSAWNDLGYARMLRGAWVMDQGGDPLADFAQAEKDLMEAARLSINYVFTWRNLGHLKLLRAIYRMGRGDDPLPEFASAEEDLKQGLQSSGADADVRTFVSDSWPPWTHRARVRIERGLYRLSRGEDPQGDLAGAHADLEVALSLNPQDAEAWAQEGRLHAGRGLAAEKAQEASSARREYETSVTCYREALRINPLLERRFGKSLNHARERLETTKEPQAEGAIPHLSDPK
jgi:serine/threonine-protein kinase